MLRTLLRWVLGVNQPFITAERAVEIARQEAHKRGTGTLREVVVREGVRAFHIWFGPFNVKPSGPVVSVDLMSGRVVGYMHYRR
jgi:hypothetical protein